MEQHFIVGDDLGFWEYLKVFHNPVRFRSVGKWFIFCTLKTLAIILALAAVMLTMAALAKKIPENPKDMISFFSVIAGCTLLLVWPFSFYNSFVAPKVFEKRIFSFLSNYLPDAVKLEKLATDTYFFVWNNTPLAIAYKNSVNYEPWPSNPTRLRKVVHKYIKISTVYSYSDDDSWDNDPSSIEPLSEGIDLAFTDFEVYARFVYGMEFLPSDVTTAIKKLISTS